MRNVSDHFQELDKMNVERMTYINHEGNLILKVL